MRTLEPLTLPQVSGPLGPIATLAEQAIDFALATAILAVIAAVIVQASYDFGLRSLINQRLLMFWAFRRVMRFRLPFDFRPPPYPSADAFVGNGEPRNGSHGYVSRWRRIHHWLRLSIRPVLFIAWKDIDDVSPREPDVFPRERDVLRLVASTFTGRGTLSLSVEQLAGQISATVQDDSATVQDDIAERSPTGGYPSLRLALLAGRTATHEEELYRTSEWEQPWQGLGYEEDETVTRVRAGRMTHATEQGLDRLQARLTRSWKLWDYAASLLTALALISVLRIASPGVSGVGFWAGMLAFLPVAGVAGLIAPVARRFLETRLIGA